MVFHKSPYISIFAPTKNLLPLTDLSVSEKREKKKGGKNIQKIGESHPKRASLKVVFRTTSSSSDSLNLDQSGARDGGSGGGYGDDLGMVYYVYIYIYTGFTKAIVHGKSEVEWCLVCMIYSMIGLVLLIFNEG